MSARALRSQRRINSMLRVRLPGETSLKEWRSQIALDRGVKPQTVYMWMVRGKMDWPIMRRVNSRVVYVRTGT